MTKYSPKLKLGHIIFSRYDFGSHLGDMLADLGVQIGFNIVTKNEVENEVEKERSTNTKNK